MTATQKKPGCLSLFFPSLYTPPKHQAETQTLLIREGMDGTHTETPAKEFPYRLRDDFLSPAEFSFYKVFNSIYSTQLTVQSKVRLADIFFVARPNENYTFFNRIAQKHLDFLICDSRTMKPLLAVELDDSSHNRLERKERDEFLDQVCQVAGLPLVRLPVKREYNTREIEERVSPFLTGIGPVPYTAQIKDEFSQTTAVPLCPKCGIPMVLRTASQGDHKGRQFYGCQNYPRCREMKPFQA
jgi:hypothetical protein